MSLSYLKVLNFIFLPLLVLVSIWFPVVQPYIFYGQISDEVQNKSVNFPVVDIGIKVDSLGFGETYPKLEKDVLLSTANAILLGCIELPELPKLKINLPFDPEVVNTINSSWQLKYSGFVVPKILISAYDKTGDEKYLKAAKDFIIGWAEFEKTQLIPRGFIWNDHAVASRASIISSFWFRYKNNSIYDKKEAEKILKLAYKTSSVLANDNLYTYKTNHGVMQNLALIKLATYFPFLPYMQENKDKAIKRLVSQFNYFVNEEGVVIEHSLGYHEFGVDLFKTAISILQINNIEIPIQWLEKYKKSLDNLLKFYRPDGTLPAVGDTDVGKSSIKPVDVSGQNNNLKDAFLLKSGYAIWWGDRLTIDKISQTFISWSYFPYMGHKHADELSLTIWGYGQNWITNVGYWPYTNHNRENAISWTGSNAPHYIGESSQSDRVSRVRNIGKAINFKFIELLRKESSGFDVNRQVLQLGDNQWFVIDSFLDKNLNRIAEVAWTLDSGLHIRELQANTFEVINPKKGSNPSQMIMAFESSGHFPVKNFYGDKSKLIGWNAAGQQIRPAHCVLVSLPSDNSWSLMAAKIESHQTDFKVNMVEWLDAENWTISQSNKLIRRKGKEVSITEGHELQYALLQSIDLASQQDKESLGWFLKVKNQVGNYYSPLIEYRFKMTCVVLIITIIIFSLRNKIRSYGKSIFLGWVGMMLWLNYYYFDV